MPTRIRAHVTPDVVRWARESLNIQPEAAAQKIRVKPEQVLAWESGEARPTIRQARLLARAYRLPLGAFFLTEPPSDARRRIPHDFRRLPGVSVSELDADLIINVQQSWDRRDFALELLELAEKAPVHFGIDLYIKNNTESAGLTLREFLGVSIKQQYGWRNTRLAFNSWRSAVEQLGVLVFQIVGIPVEDIRAYSLAVSPLPVISVNRKDAYSARCFSLMHELVHLGLHQEGLCDLRTRVDRPSEDQRLEIFCNAVAAAVLIPKEDLLSQPELGRLPTGGVWEDEEIQSLARRYSVSREALLRRLLTLQYTTSAFYDAKRREYRREYEERPSRSSGYVSPPINTISELGQPFVSLVLDSMYSENITTSDASDALGLRRKHFEDLAQIIELRS